ncbi:MAG: hypothetical protein JW912_03135 [Sedimentisphaerales bacterium]|nr:hypothetical protein [Sedimentisphaerales bacterium]
MKKVILLCVTTFLAAAGLVQAQGSELHGSIGTDFSSKYIWRGFDVFDDHAAIHPYVDLDLFNTGFGFNAVAHRANSSGFEMNERWDYTLYYHNSLFEGETYATNYRLGYVYYNYPDRSSHDTSDSMDLQEVHAILSWPNVFSIEGLVPSYCLVKLWPSSSDSLVGDSSPSGGSASGYAHIFMLDYALPVSSLGEDRTLNLHSEFVYNDGVSPNGATDVDHDWSNAVFGVSTTFDLGKNLFFTPGIYYQSSWEDTVNPEDEFWVNLNLTYKF